MEYISGWNTLPWQKSLKRALNTSDCMQHWLSEHGTELCCTIEGRVQSSGKLDTEIHKLTITLVSRWKVSALFGTSALIHFSNNVLNSTTSLWAQPCIAGRPFLDSDDNIGESMPFSPIRSLGDRWGPSEKCCRDWSMPLAQRSVAWKILSLFFPCSLYHSTSSGRAFPTCIASIVDFEATENESTR